MRTVAATLCLMLTLTLSAQADRRDEITLTTGEVLRGRVVQRYEPTELMYLEGGSRRKLLHARVKSVRTVAAAVADLLDLRRPELSLAADWSLVEAAMDQELPEMATLLAYHVLLRDAEHAGAHAALGHVQSAGKWRWRLKDEFLAAATFQRRTNSDRFTLHSEHFTLESRSGLRTAVDALLDLERIYATFWRELGHDLRPLSLFPRIEVHLHPSLHDLPKLSSTMAEPYCDPSVSGGGIVHTYQEATMPRPARLAAVAIEQLLYRTLLDARASPPPTIDERIAPWVEVGLGRFYDSRATGKAGYLAFGDAKLDPQLAGQVLRYRPYGLENFIHVTFLAFHEDPVVTPFHIAHAAMLVAYLMDAKSTAGTPAVALRPRFLAYVRACLHDGKGNSSSELDAVLGPEIERIERLETAWIAWLATTSGQPALRQKHTLRPTRSLRDRVLGPLIR